MSHGICHTVRRDLIEAMGREQQLTIDTSATMAQLGHSAGIAVGAAVIAILSE